MTAADSADAFATLADPTRLAIIEALAEANRETPDEPGLSFSELHDRVGIEDSGQFNYHLDKLVGRFVERTEDGYKLSYAGIRVSGAIFSGFYADPETIDAGELGPCPACGDTIEVAYEAGLLEVGCPNGHTFADLVPPRAFEGRDIEAVVEAVATAAIGRIRQAQRGACPLCFGPVEWSVIKPSAGADASMAVAIQGQCRTCGVPFAAPPGAFVLWDPAVQARLYDRGIAIWEDPVRWIIAGMDWRVESADPDAGRTSVSGDLPGCSVSATLNERGEVVDVDILDA